MKENSKDRPELVLTYYVVTAGTGWFDDMTISSNDPYFSPEPFLAIHSGFTVFQYKREAPCPE